MQRKNNIYQFLFVANYPVWPTSRANLKLCRIIRLSVSGKKIRYNYCEGNTPRMPNHSSFCLSPFLYAHIYLLSLICISSSLL